MPRGRSPTSSSTSSSPTKNSNSATASFEADRDMLKIVGDGTVLGAATHIEVNRAAGEEGSATVTFALDAAARAKRNLNFGSWLTGTLPVKLKAPLSRTSAEVEIDLTPAGIDNPVPGVSKPAGKPGKATFLVKPAPEGSSLSNIAIDLGAPMMRGSAQMGADGAIQSATITQARIAPGDDFKADVVNSQSALKVSVRGTTLDARAFVKSLFDGTPTGPAEGKDLDLDVKVATVVGANRQAITGLELTAYRRGGETRLGTLRGRIGGGRGDRDRERRRNAAHDHRRRRAGPLRRPLFAPRGRRSRSGLAVQGRGERGRSDPHQFRAARRAGVPPAGRRPAGHARRRTAARPSILRSRAFRR